MFFSFKMDAQVQELNWHSLNQQNGIEIFYAIGNCTNTQKLFLKVNNDTVINIDASFILVIHPNENEEFEFPFMLIVNSNEEIVINCENSLNSPTILDISIPNQETFTCAVKDLVINVQTKIN